MIIGDDVAARVDDDAGAHAVDAMLCQIEIEILLAVVEGNGPFAVNVDHRSLDPLDHFDQRGPAKIGPRPCWKFISSCRCDEEEKGDDFQETAT